MEEHEFRMGDLEFSEEQLSNVKWFLDLITDGMITEEKMDVPEEEQMMTEEQIDKKKSELDEIVERRYLRCSVKSVRAFIDTLYKILDSKLSEDMKREHVLNCLRKNRRYVPDLTKVMEYLEGRGKT